MAGKLRVLKGALDGQRAGHPSMEGALIAERQYACK
jgi:hypothetical protein